MGGVYRRGNKLWIWYFNVAGERIFEPTSSRVGEDARARKTLETLERRIEAEKRTGVPAGELTVKAYGERWVKGRPAQGIGTAADEATRLRLHAWPGLGHLLLKDLPLFAPGKPRLGNGPARSTAAKTGQGCPVARVHPGVGMEREALPCRQAPASSFAPRLGLFVQLEPQLAGGARNHRPCLDGADRLSS